MKLWWLIAILAACTALIVWLWPNPTAGAISLVTLVCSVWLGRIAAHRSPGRNLQDAGRELSWRFVVKLHALAAVFFAAAIGWVAVMTRVAPGNYIGAAIIFIPALGAIVVGTVYLGKAAWSLIGGRRI